MDKKDHLMAEKNENNKDRQKGQVTPKKCLKKIKNTRYCEVSCQACLILQDLRSYFQSVWERAQAQGIGKSTKKLVPIWENI